MVRDSENENNKIYLSYKKILNLLNIQNIKTSLGRDITIANKKLVEKQPELLSIGLEPIAQAPNTVTVENYEEMTELGSVKFCEDNDKK